MSQHQRTDADIQRIIAEAFEDGIRAARSATSKARETPYDGLEQEGPGAGNGVADEGHIEGHVESGEAAVYDTIATQLTEIFGHIVANLRHKRNALAPIEALTDDLLSRVFLCAVADGDTHDKLELAHVCTRWRNLILSDARIWTDINLCDNLQHVRECMKRAQDAKLDIRYLWSFDKPFRGEELLVILNERAKQIRSLSIVLPTTEFNTVGHTLLSTSLASARFVTLAAVPQGWEDEADIVDPSIEELFGNDAPELRYLRLQKIGLPWTISQFSKLTTIMLDKCHFTNPTPNADFITILETLPSLRQLQLNDCRSLCRPGPLISDYFVDLPELQVAQLDGLRLRDMTQILSVLKTSPSLRLVGKLRFREDEAVTFSHLNLPEISSLDTICDLEVEIQHNNLRTVDSVSLTGSSVKSGSNKNFQFSLSGVVSHVFPTLCDPFRFTRLRRLSLNWIQCGWGTPILVGDGFDVVQPAHTESDVLLYFLHRCPDIVSLKLCGSHPDILDVLSQSVEGAATTPPCTKLHTLVLDRASVTDDSLRNLVLRRPGCVNLRSLTLSTSNGFKKDTVLWLRERIEDVCWDNEANNVTTFDPPSP